MRDFGNTLISLLDRVKDREAAIGRMVKANRANGWPELDNPEDEARSYLLFLEMAEQGKSELPRTSGNDTA